MSQLESTRPVDTPPQMVMVQMVCGGWVSQSIYAAAKLGIADQLQNGPRSCAELATLTNANARSLYRLLRALAGMGILTEDERGFSLTPLGDCLRSIEGIPV